MVKPEKKSEPVNRKLRPDEMKESVSNLSIFNKIDREDIFDLINGLMDIVLKTNKYDTTINYILINLFSARFRDYKEIQYVNVYENKAGNLECCLSVDDADVYKLNRSKLKDNKNALVYDYDSEEVLDSIKKNIHNIRSICTKNDLKVQIMNNSMSYYTHKHEPTKIYFSWDFNGTFDDYLENDCVKMFTYLYEYQKDMKCPEYLKLPMIELLKDILGDYIYDAIVDGFDEYLKHDESNVLVYAKDAHANSVIKDILTKVLKIPLLSIKNEDLNEEMVHTSFKYPFKIKLLDNPVVYGSDEKYNETKETFNTYNKLKVEYEKNKVALNRLEKASNEYIKRMNKKIEEYHSAAERIRKGEKAPDEDLKEGD